jgi:NAD(P)-dependent dehydrogenase (short-subunit alcohol dehydrogenase family)
MRNMEEIAENTHRTDLAGTNLTPELFATAAHFLASGESAFISGHNLVLDGGSTTRKTNFWGILMRDSTF